MTTCDVTLLNAYCFVDLKKIYIIYIIENMLRVNHFFIF